MLKKKPLPEMTLKDARALGQIVARDCRVLLKEYANGKVGAHVIVADYIRLITLIGEISKTPV